MFNIPSILSSLDKYVRSRKYDSIRTQSTSKDKTSRGRPHRLSIEWCKAIQKRHWTTNRHGQDLQKMQAIRLEAGTDSFNTEPRNRKERQTKQTGIVKKLFLTLLYLDYLDENYYYCLFMIREVWYK